MRFKEHEIAVMGGRPVNPFQFREADIDIDDIAHGLSNLCRFTGRTQRFYSVAEHSVRVSRLCKKEHRLYGLLHDAAEAFVGDQAKPLKKALWVTPNTWGSPREFTDVEDGILSVILPYFGLPSCSLPEEVEAVDARVTQRELTDYIVYPRPLEDGECLTPERAKALFMSEFHLITGRARICV